MSQKIPPPPPPPPKKRETVYQQARTRAIDYEWARTQALIILAPHLAEKLKGEGLPEALQAIRSTMNENDRTEALIKLIPSLPDDSLRDVLQSLPVTGDKRNREDVLVALASRLPSHLLPGVLQDIIAIEDEDD